MDMIAQKKENKRYLRHELSTKINSVKFSRFSFFKKGSLSIENGVRL